ncbi:GNAT family N-acetyltransferase [soil metagenome]
MSEPTTAGRPTAEGAAQPRPPIRPPDPPLATDALLLRPLVAADIEAVFEACQDRQVVRWTTIPQPYLREHAIGFVADTIDAWELGRDPTFAIVDRHSGRMVGCVGLRGESHGGHAMEIGYWMAPAGRGRGLMTEAVKLVSRWALDDLAVERVGLLVYVGNDASARVAERAGYQREGLLRRYAMQRGVARDCVIFSLLRDDPAVDAAPSR